MRLLVVFGSRASGEQRPDSDTDVAVMLDSPIGLDERFGLEGAIGRALGIKGRTDLVILDANMSTTLGREIARAGRVVFDRDGEQWADFVSLAVRRYADFEPFRERRRKVLMGEPIE